MIDYDGAAGQLNLHGIFRAAELVSRYKDGSLSSEEVAELDRWLAEDERHRKWFDDLLNPGNLVEQEEALKAFKDTGGVELSRTLTDAGIVHSSKVRTRAAWTVAASVSIILLGLASLYVYRLRTTNTVSQVTAAAAVKNDLPPGGNKATLTLGDGSVISLDSTGNGLLATQGKMKVVKVGDGEVSYSGESGKDIVFNTLTTPVAGKFQIVLSDGTKVWLNSSSSLVYPSSFEGGERTVTLSGEGYFEVAKNKAMPFIVKLADGNSVKVLGTHFDVMAYKDEPSLKTTLLEGSVSVQSGQASSLLKPGECAEIPTPGTVRIVKGVDVDEAIAWKQGLFQFQNADLSVILRQVSRWYGVTVVYKNQIHTEPLKGMAPRNVNLSKLLEGLSGMTGVHFTLNENQLIVSNE